MTDAASHDSNSVIPHLQRLRERVPEALAGVEFLLDDAAADDPKLREQVNQDFQLTLRSSLNPRRRKPLTEDLPKGMNRLTPYGELICDGEQSLEYLGVRWKNERFLYGPPRTQEKTIACLSCSQKEDADSQSPSCPHAAAGRLELAQFAVTLPFDCLPHINPQDPPMAKRFQAMRTLRVRDGPAPRGRTGHQTHQARPGGTVPQPTRQRLLSGEVRQNAHRFPSSAARVILPTPGGHFARSRNHIDTQPKDEVGLPARRKHIQRLFRTLQSPHDLSVTRSSTIFA